MADEEIPPEEETPSEEEEPKVPPEEEEKEPPIRTPKASSEQTEVDKRLGFLERSLERIGGKIDKLSSDYSAGEGEPLGGEKEDITQLRKEFDEKLEGLKEEQTSEGLLSSFLAKFPSYKEYEAKIRKYMNHPAYRKVPIGFIADGIAGQDLEAKGAEKAKKAEEEAEETKTGGSSVRKTPTGEMPDIWGMSKEDFQQYQAEVRQKGRDK